MCVIQEYRFCTVSLSQFLWCFQYHESMSIPWVHVYTMIPCLYNEFISIPWVHVYTMSSCVYHESMSIPWFYTYTMSPCLCHESWDHEPITTVIVHTNYRKTKIKIPETQIPETHIIEIKKYKLQKYTNINYRWAEIQNTGLHKYKLNKLHP